MSNLLSFPNNRLEKEEAGQWLARVDRGLTPDEQDALSEWLREQIGRASCRERV